MLAVLGALVANGLITILKFIGALITGSAGLMAESLHLLAIRQTRFSCCPESGFINVRRRKNTLSVTERSDFSGRLSRRFLFSASARLTPFTRESKRFGSRTSRKIFFGLTGFWASRLSSKPVQSRLPYIRKSTKRITRE